MSAPRLLLMLLCGATTAAHAGTFLKFGGQPDSLVVHPDGYTGSGATLNVSVCLNPSLPPNGGIAQAEQSIRNVVAEYNRFQGKLGNVLVNPAPASDFEGVMLHEIGHCIGMDHPTYGPSEVGSGSPMLYFANAGNGPNGVKNTDDGTDNVRATRDDVRSDDVNFNWFRNNVNDPFQALPAVIDRTNHSILTSNLPAGHNYVEVSTAFDPCESSVNSSGLRGQARTQNTMFPVICGNNLLRELARDDVRLLRIARAGVDGTQGTSDDYTTTLTYAGQTSNCDIVIGFSDSTGFAQCNVSATIGGGLGADAAITSGTITARLSVNWHFNQVDTTGSAVGPTISANSPASGSTTAMAGGTIGAQVTRNITFTVSGGSGAGTTDLLCQVNSGTVAINSGGNQQNIPVGGSTSAVVARFTLTASAQAGQIGCTATPDGGSVANFTYNFTAPAGTPPSSCTGGRIMKSGFENTGDIACP